MPENSEGAQIIIVKSQHILKDEDGNVKMIVFPDGQYGYAHAGKIVSWKLNPIYWSQVQPWSLKVMFKTEIPAADRKDDFQCDIPVPQGTFEFEKEITFAVLKPTHRFSDAL